jgi:hypothetical protein
VRSGPTQAVFKGIGIAETVLVTSQQLSPPDTQQQQSGRSLPGNRDQVIEGNAARKHKTQPHNLPCHNIQFSVRVLPSGFSRCHDLLRFSIHGLCPWKTPLLLRSASQASHPRHARARDTRKHWTLSPSGILCTRLSLRGTHTERCPFIHRYLTLLPPTTTSLGRELPPPARLPYATFD